MEPLVHCLSYISQHFAFRNARIETLLLFAQTIYLIFSSVYVCKEAVEHLLLSVGDGHHHHPGDDGSGHEG